MSEGNGIDLVQVSSLPSYPQFVVVKVSTIYNMRKKNSGSQQRLQKIKAFDWIRLLSMRNISRMAIMSIIADDNELCGKVAQK